MEDESRKKLKVGIGCASIMLVIGGMAGFALRDNSVMSIGQPIYALNNNGSLINCGDYSTNLNSNISHDEVLSFVPESDNFNNMSFSTEDITNISDIVTNISFANAQFYRQETGKTGYSSWKFGTGSKAGSITFTLSEDIDAVGFYAVAYANSKDTGKYLSVNGTKVNQALDAATPFNAESVTQRFFVELEDATDEITIAANTASNNRFYLYSVGFYTKN